MNAGYLSDSLIGLIRAIHKWVHVRDTCVDHHDADIELLQLLCDSSVVFQLSHGAKVGCNMCAINPTADGLLDLLDAAHHLGGVTGDDANVEALPGQVVAHGKTDAIRAASHNGPGAFLTIAFENVVVALENRAHNMPPIYFNQFPNKTDNIEQTNCHQ